MFVKEREKNVKGSIMSSTISRQLDLNPIVTKSEKEKSIMELFDLYEESRQYGLTPSKTHEEIGKMPYKQIKKIVEVLRNRIFLAKRKY